MKFFALILMVITFAGTFIPCCQFDNCGAEEHALVNNHNEDENEGQCSPFTSCASCAPSIELLKTTFLAPPPVIAQVHYEQLQVFDLSAFAPICWQPPRCS